MPHLHTLSSMLAKFMPFTDFWNRQGNKPVCVILGTGI